MLGILLNIWYLINSCSCTPDVVVQYLTLGLLCTRHFNFMHFISAVRMMKDCRKFVLPLCVYVWHCMIVLTNWLSCTRSHIFASNPRSCVLVNVDTIPNVRYTGLDNPNSVMLELSKLYIVLFTSREKTTPTNSMISIETKLA